MADKREFVAAVMALCKASQPTVIQLQHVMVCFTRVANHLLDEPVTCLLLTTDELLKLENSPHDPDR